MKLTKFYRNAFAICAFFLAPISGFAAYVTSAVPPGGGTAPAASFVGRTINVTDFGAKCDVQTGTGSIPSLVSNTTFTATQPTFTSTDVGKPIVITGAGNWSLTGIVSPSSTLIYNVGYNTATNGGTLFNPSLIGAAGGASAAVTAGTSLTNTTIATGYYQTPETGTAVTTGTTTVNMYTVTVASVTPPLIGQNGQEVSTATNTPVTIPIVADHVYGMPIASSSGDIPAGSTVYSITGNTITFTNSGNSPAMASTPNETIYIGGYIMVLAGSVTTSVLQPATISIPGAPLATTISGYSSSTVVYLSAPAANVVPTWAAVKATNTIGIGASGWHPGDLILIDDGPGHAGATVLRVVNVDSNGAPLNTSVYAQTQLNALLLGPYSVVSTSGSGTHNPTFSVQYTATGTFWYGTDDTEAINQALSAGVSYSATASSVSGTAITLQNMPRGIVVGMFVTDTQHFLPANTIVTGVNYAASQITVSQTGSVTVNDTLAIAGPAQLPQGSDVWLPANSACGVTSTVDLPNGKNSLRGWDTGSQIVALAQMPLDANGYSYVVGVPYNTYAFGGGMRDLNVGANKLAQFACGIEGGEQQLYSNVACVDAVTAEWLCGYPVAGSVNNQISDTVFDHIIGTTPFVSFGPIALKPAENFLTASSCSAEQVVNSYFRNGWMNIFDSQPAYNFYGGNIMDSIEPFNAEYCIQVSGKQMVGDTRCLDASAAGIYITGNNATVHDYFENWDNAAPWPSTMGALIGAGTDGVLVDGIGGGSRLPTYANVVVQQGAPGRSTIVVNSPGATFVAAGPGYGIPNPQGRLTLQSGSPVMTGNVSGVSTVYYDCYTGQNVPFFNGGSNQLDMISACELSVPLSSTGPGLEHANDVFDVWWWHNGGSPVLCIATNGLGAGWTGDSGGNLNQRGTGYTQLSQSSSSSRGYITNQNPFTNNGTSAGSYCYGWNGTSLVDFVGLAPAQTIPAEGLTYLGSFYTTAAGQTSFVPQPTPAAGGANALVGIWNGYNRVPVSAVEQDSATAYSAATSATWEIADAVHAGGSKNYITVVDGNQQTSFDLLLTQVVSNVGSALPQLSIADVTATTTCPTTSTPVTFTSQQSTSPISVTYTLSKPPLLGLHCAQAMEKAANITSLVFNNNSALTMHLNWQY